MRLCPIRNFVQEGRNDKSFTVVKFINYNANQNYLIIAIASIGNSSSFACFTFTNKKRFIYLNT